ncbi:hypothetical protein [Pseudoalteromonas rubra]|uniref:hypothetical protein n=1 Tax=Pseudoalteromonas rubra TaxID=43658 RepID=UPI000F7A69AE|nr:hypothetical protein [Pseudoalteromonas rubra]
MSTSKNRHGLSRTISESVKRKIRQRCGFGCVKCGCAVYQYEHVDPEFSDAKIHDPERIVLLCGGCHDLVTRGLLSKESIKQHSMNPKCFQTGFSFGPFDIGACDPEVTLGTYKCKKVKTLISVYGEPVLSVDPPEFKHGPFIINAYMSDREGNELLRIERNEWKSRSENWDVEVVGNRITIRKKLGDIALVIRSEPPNKLIFERVNMLFKGVKISCKDSEHITVVTPRGQFLYANAMEVYDYDKGLNIIENGFELPSGGGEHSRISFGRCIIDCNGASIKRNQ